MVDENQKDILNAAEAVIRAGGNKTTAALNLGIPRKTLTGRLDRGVRDSILNADLTVSATALSMGHTVLVIPDLHIPFQHPDTIPFLLAVQETYNCDTVVSLGDEVDMCAISNYPSDPEGLSAGDEYTAALSELEHFYEAFPDVVVCTSNHTMRPYRKAFLAGIPERMLKPYGELLRAPIGWSWHDEIFIDGVRYIHGEGFGGIHAHVNAATKYMQSVVIGHIHAHSGVRIVNARSNVFGMNAGCLLDSTKYAFKYAKYMPVPVTLGCGVVKRGNIAHFIPMLTDSDNRWVGEI